jgi:hypothetical protein
MAAGATAYYFAKKDIDSHRREQELKGIRGTEYLECTPPLIPFGPLAFIAGLGETSQAACLAMELTLKLFN